MESHRKKKKISSTTTTNKKRTKPLPTLPDCLITEVLSWMPATSLLRFRRACEAWEDLIKDPSFIKLHLQHTSSTSNENFSLMVKVGGDFEKFYRIDFHGDSSSSGNKLVELDCPLNNSEYNCATIMGSCNGLFCVRVTDTYNDPITYVWNPSTEQYKVFPCANHIDDDEYAYDCDNEPESPVYGFGYDSTIDDYKVVCIDTYYEKIYGAARYPVQVYTLGSKPWRRIGDFPCTMKPSSPGVFVNGAIHWLVYADDGDEDIYNDNGAGEKKLIVALDLADEKYHEIKVPDCFSNDVDDDVENDVDDDVDSLESFDDRHVEVNLCVLDGSLCVLRNVGDTRLDVWMMKDYGVQASWIKMLTIAEPRVESDTGKLNKGLPGKFFSQTNYGKTRFQNSVRLQPKGSTGLLLSKRQSKSSTKVFENLDDLKLIKMVKHGNIIVNYGEQSSYLLYGPNYERARNLKVEGSIVAYVGSLILLDSGPSLESEEEDEDEDNEEDEDEDEDEFEDEFEDEDEDEDEEEDEDEDEFDDD